VGVKYVLSEPTPPGWWAKNKALVYAVAGLVAGFWIAGGCDRDASPHERPGPSPSPSVSRPAR
jgi:hypothetical protein